MAGDSDTIESAENERRTQEIILKVNKEVLRKLKEQEETEERLAKLVEEEKARR